MFSIFSRKPKKTVTVVDPSLQAKLEAVQSVPAAARPSARAACTVTAMRVEGPRLVGDDLSKYAFKRSKLDLAFGETAFVVEGLSGGPLAVANFFVEAESTYRLRIVRVDKTDTRPTQMVTAAQPVAESTLSVASQVACVSDSRLLIGLRYDQQGQQRALYTYDVAASRYEKVADVTGEGQNLSKLFEVQHVSPDTALVLHYSDLVRKSADNYHNYYNHVLLFSPQHPNGRELLKLGIDDGNVESWALENGVLYLRTVDARDPANRRTAMWSLDLGKVIRPELSSGAKPRS